MESQISKEARQSKDGAGQKALEDTTPRKDVFGPVEVQEYLRQKSEAAKADFKRFGLEPRGEVDNLPDLREGEKRVCPPLFQL